MHLAEMIFHSLEETLKLIPFLFVTYLLMELLEHKAGDASRRMIQKAGAFGPIAGAVLGILPQCGFSAAASSLYAGRIITLGTLFSVYLSTSDEMLPIMISAAAPVSLIVKVLLCKVIVGFVAGILIDMICRRGKDTNAIQLKEKCDNAHCHCEEGILKEAFTHTLKIAVFICLVTFVLHFLLHEFGEEALSGLLRNHGIVGELVAGLIGLIPNCAASVMVTQLYLEGVISFGAMISGLLSGSGVGLLVLYRVNGNIKENMKITVLLYGIAITCGIIINCLGIG